MFALKVLYYMAVNETTPVMWIVDMRMMDGSKNIQIWSGIICNTYQHRTL